MKKLLSLALSLLLAAAACLLSACDDRGGPGGYEDDTMSYSHLVYNVRTVAQLTGEDAVTDTLAGWQIGGTDLGFPLYNSRNGTMYLAFGDTFQRNTDMTGMWRSNVLAETKDFDLSDGLTIDGFYTGPTGLARAVIEGVHEDGNEMTKIPTGGIEVGGTMYLFYMSVRSWTTPGEWLVNYCSCVKSEDDGKTWRRVYGMTFFNDLEGELLEQAVTLANSDVSLQEGAGSVTPEGRVAPNFMQVFPVDGKDGYIYLFGLPQGRSGGAKLARVRAENIENFEEYEYFTGRSGEGPVFAKGAEGLAAANKAEGAYVIMPTVGEISVMYNAYLKKWMAVFYKANALVFCTADALWGEWSSCETLITAAEYPGLYGGMCHEKFSADGGKTFYFFLSQWMPVYNTFVMEVTLV